MDEYNNLRLVGPNAAHKTSINDDLISNALGEELASYCRVMNDNPLLLIEQIPHEARCSKRTHGPCDCRLRDFFQAHPRELTKLKAVTRSEWQQPHWSTPPELEDIS